MYAFVYQSFPFEDDIVNPPISWYPLIVLPKERWVYGNMLLVHHLFLQGNRGFGLVGVDGRLKVKLNVKISPLLSSMYNFQTPLLPLLFSVPYLSYLFFKNSTIPVFLSLSLPHVHQLPTESNYIFYGPHFDSPSISPLSFFYLTIDTCHLYNHK